MRRLLAQAPGDDGVEVAGETRGGNGSRALGRRDAARRRRLGVEQQLHRARDRQPAALERPRTAEQLVQHDAERVDVGRGGDPLAGELLGRGVVGGERCPGRFGRAFGAAGRFRVQELRDAEVEELHPAVGVDQDVARLEIAMDHEVAMGVAHRVADLAEQLQPFVEVAAARAAVLGERQPFDELEDGVGAPVGGDAAVEQPGDPRVLQSRQDPALGAEALEQRRRVTTQELDRGLLPELAVGARRAIDLAGAAGADERIDPPGPEPRAGEQATRVGSGAGVGLAGVEHAGALIVRREQRLDLAPQPLVPRRRCRQERGAPLRVQLDRLAEQRLHTFPRHARHGASSTDGCAGRYLNWCAQYRCRARLRPHRQHRLAGVSRGFLRGRRLRR